MPRQPEMFVRELDPAEAQRLVKITRTARDRIRLRRAGIVLALVQGRSAVEAAAMFAATAQYAREVIHAFNKKGFAALDPKWSGGRPRKFGPHARELICRVARTPPQQAGLSFTTWSLSKLVEHLGQRHRIVASIETVRQVLREAGVRWQATKTWKASRDPEFTAKMTRVLALYDQSAAGQIPAGGRVICVDEFGPLNLQPRPGRGRFPSGRPVRQRATYHRRSSARCTPRVVGPVPRETPDVALPDLRGLSAHRLAHPHDGAASPYQPREPQYVSEPRRSPRTGPSPRPLAAAF